MAKSGKLIFVCNNCGNEFSKWSGRCASCGEWNSLAEVKNSLKNQRRPTHNGKSAHRSSEIMSLDSVSVASDSSRLKTGYMEFDRTLGGGFVPGQVILLAGEPGIGKSTLLLQIANAVNSVPNSKSSVKDVLYVAGEESSTQIKQRAQRLGINGQNIDIFSTTDADEIEGLVSPEYKLLIVDSIQTISSLDVASSAGSVAQVKECAVRLSQACKEVGLPLILVGHVNKEGDIAGPKVLEHVVDTVLYLEGERTLPFRLLRCIKNRFGDPSEVGVWQMSDKGFIEVENPALAFINEKGSGAGTVVTINLEGNRPILVEIQALTTKTSFGYPRRTATGYDLNRLFFIIAVLEKHLKLPLHGVDIYVNVTGGVKIDEPAADLAVALAIVSSLKFHPIKPGTVVFGEVGLTSEVRSVILNERRAKEAVKLGFKRLVYPGVVHNIKEAVIKALD